jgi:hypothetical protein
MALQELHLVRPLVVEKHQARLERRACSAHNRQYRLRRTFSLRTRSKFYYNTGLVLNGKKDMVLDYDGHQL